MTFISNDQTSEVLQPAKQPLDLPPSSISLQPTSILSRIPSGSTMWGNDFNAVESQFCIEAVRVVGVVTDQVLRRLQQPSLTRWTQLASLRGEWLSVQTETGNPLRSATAMIFVPLPRFVFPTLCPFFRGREGRVNESLSHINCPYGSELRGKRSHDFCYHA